MADGGGWSFIFFMLMCCLPRVVPSTRLHTPPPAETPEESTVNENLLTNSNLRYETTPIALAKRGSGSVHVSGSWLPSMVRLIHSLYERNATISSAIQLADKEKDYVREGIF